MPARTDGRASTDGPEIVEAPTVAPPDVGFPDGAATEKVRLIARLGGNYVLRGLRLVSEMHGGDFVRGIVAMGIIAANTSHLNPRCDNPASYQDLGELLPDDQRRPVSVLSLARSLGIPFETTRRHVNALIKDGYCTRVSGGVIFCSAALASPQNTRALMANAASARRFMREMARAGVGFEAGADPASGGERK